MALILAALGGVGVGAVPPPAEVPPVEKSLQAPHESAILRLKSLVEAAEKALEAEDSDTASNCAEEAEVLIADWSPEVLRRADISKLIERLRDVLKQTEADSEEADEGLQITEEEVSLSEGELKAERDQVLAAEQGGGLRFPHRPQ